MSLVIESESTDAQRADIQLTLSWREADRLRITLPSLLRALADRPTASQKQRERRRKAHTALEGLLAALSSQLQQVEEAGVSS